MNRSSSESEPPWRSGRAAVSVSVTPSVLEIDFADPDSLLSPAEAGFLSEKTDAAAKSLGLGGEVRVRVLADEAMAAAHERYSNVLGTTDVLTFDLRNEAQRAAAPGDMDVDIMICIDEARRAAAVRGHSVEHELLLYIVHGLLHCLGHDDHDEAAYARMHALEDAVLKSIGVGPVFAAPVRGDGGVV